MSIHEPDFDWSQAASLLGDDPNQVAEDMGAIVVELIEGADKHLQELKKKNPETDRKTIAAEAHQLRGSLLNFGFAEVGKILLKIEKNEYASDDYIGMIEHTESVFAVSKKMLAARYPSINLA